MNKNLELLHPYPFAKLQKVKIELAQKENRDLTNFETELTKLSIGEPQDLAPKFVLQNFKENLSKFNKYPTSLGLLELRQAISSWFFRRFNFMLDAKTEVLPVNGTREGLFAIAQAVLNDAIKDTENANLVLIPNPFYQIYEGAAFIAGGRPIYLNNNNSEDDALGQPKYQEIQDEVWQKTALLYICNPANPSGACLSKTTLDYLIHKAREFNFVLVADECYSEIYFADNTEIKTHKPLGLLQVAKQLKYKNPLKNLLVFHSLSKRSNLPGLRSGFVAGDSEILSKFLLYRTYHGCSMSIPTQLASIVAWNDDNHVIEIRKKYTARFIKAKQILTAINGFRFPDASFYLWLNLHNLASKNNEPSIDLLFSKYLLQYKKVEVLPGSFLARNSIANLTSLNEVGLKPNALGKFNTQQITAKVNPGEGFVRIALVEGGYKLEQALNQINQAYLSLDLK